MSESPIERNDVVSETAVDAAATPERQRSTVGLIAGWAWGVVVTLLYVVAVINAIGNLLGMQQMAASLGTGLSPLGWFWLVGGAILPIVVYGVALILSRGRAPALRILVLFAGIAVLSAFQLEIMHLVPQYLYFAL